MRTNLIIFFGLTVLCAFTRVGELHVTTTSIQYINLKAPGIQRPNIDGQRYVDLVPATLDLAERALLAIHGTTNCTDPNADYEVFESISHTDKGEMTLKHSYHDFNSGQAKWQEGLVLMRNVCGSKYNLHIDQGMMQQVMHMVGEDGLYWIPTKGTPWAGTDDPNQLVYTNNLHADHVFNSWPNGRIIMALAAWHARDPENAAVRSTLERMIRGLNKTAIKRDDYAYMYEKRFRGVPAEYRDAASVAITQTVLPGATTIDQLVPSAGMPTGHSASVTQSTTLPGVAAYYRMTKFEPARTFAEKFTRYMLGPAAAIDSEGRLTSGGFISSRKAYADNPPLNSDGKFKGRTHFHGMTLFTTGLLDWGVATHNAEFIEKSKKVYEFVRAEGNPLVGWFPEMCPAEHSGCETCQVSDMITLAAKLSHLRAGDYWEDVERYVRNQWQSIQATDTFWLQTHLAKNPGAKSFDPKIEAKDNVANRVRGIFLGMGNANGTAVTTYWGCCNGNAMRGLFFAWRWAIEDDGGKFKVNLLLNRASAAADVYSYLPNQGTVVVKMKQARDLRVRIPSWAGNEAEAEIDGQVAQAKMDGRYLDIGPVKAGQKVTITMPLKHEVIETVTYDQKFTVQLRGFNVVDIYPRHGLRPFYVDENQKRDEPLWMRVERYVPDKELDW